MSDDIVFQLRPWWWRFGVRILGDWQPWVQIRRCWLVRTYSADVRLPPTYVFSVTYAFSSSTYSGDERDSATLYWCTWFVDVRILPTYVFHRRTYFPGVRVLLTYAYRDYKFRRCTYVFYRRTYSINVRVLSTHVFNRRTHSVDVRDSATYVFGTKLLEIEIRDYAEHSGLWIWCRRSPSTRFQALV